MTHTGLKMSDVIGVLLRGLPFNVTIDDIIQFFKTIQVHKSCIEMIHMYNGKFSGLAFVELHSKEEIRMALLMDRNHIGDRYIDVMEINDDKLDQIRKAAISGIRRLELHRMCTSVASDYTDYDVPSSSSGRDHRARSRSPLMLNPRTRYAYVTGFPQNTLYKGVRAFFDGCIIGTGCVHLFRAENDRFRGDGYIEFASSDELKKALRRNGDLYQGTNKITIEPCSEEEVVDMKPYMMEKARPLGRTGPHFEEGYGGYRSAREGGGGDYGNRYSHGRSDGGYRGNGYHSNSRGRGKERSSRYGDHSHGSGSSNRGQYHKELDSIGTVRSVSIDRRHSSDHVTRDHYDLSYRIDRYPSLYTSSGGNIGNHGHHALPTSGTRDNKNKTLRMSGMSLTTGISDVVLFFKNYGIQYEDVRIQCYDDGTPNGKAFVTFPSERIASAALHDMNRRLLKGNYVELLPV